MPRSLASSIRETDIENYFVGEAARRLNAEVYKTVAVGRVAYPDRTLFWLGVKGHGNTKLVELKKPGEKPTKRQLIEHHRLANVGQEVAVCSTHDEVDALFDELEQWE